MTLVKKGDIWEFDNKEERSVDRYALVYIMKVDHQSINPDNDTFTYLVIEDSENAHIHISHGHLTMRSIKYGRLWRKVA